eukprot:TRINITY_DN12368_c0_g1_i3.p1 TRINITY_DN12368_c0_g1~~TRINITY_DN12368_c0_g1_i3.p1  ORF type:complete len:294 (+),score=47.84 TRINITY_DN12368_c0_g1_i3:68-949(+)
MSERKVLEDSIETFSFMSNGHGVKISEVEVTFDPETFKMHEDAKTREEIEGRWKAICSKNSRIYNKSKFRLDNLHYKDSSVKLDVGLTDYKDLQGTNLTESSANLVDHSKEDGKRFKKLSQAIGVGGWVITSDKKSFFIENATWKGEQGGKLDRPGGHPEPGDACTDCGQSDETKLSSDQVLKELFLSEQKEIRDEINIPLEIQGEPELLGAVFNLDMGGRIGLEFRIDVDLTSDQVLQHYKKGDQKEADESTGLVFFDLDQVHSFDQSILSRLTPHATGSLRFLRDIVKNSK